MVEDDDLLRSALVEALRDAGWTVHEAGHGVGIEGVMRGFDPHVVVLSVHLPLAPDGYEIARRIQETSDTPVLLLTAAAREDERLAGFEADADDYVLKPFSTTELLARLHALVRGGAVAEPVGTIGDITIDETAQQVSRGGRPIKLSNTEFSLFAAMAREPGRTFTKRELLRLLWNYEEGNPNVVEVHVSSLRRKLEEHGPRVVHTVRGHGYVVRA